MGEMTDAYKILFQKLKGKRPSGIPVINIVWIGFNWLKTQTSGGIL
jgi:hypothetical protein